MPDNGFQEILKAVVTIRGPVKLRLRFRGGFAPAPASRVPNLPRYACAGRVIPLGLQLHPLFFARMARVAGATLF